MKKLDKKLVLGVLAILIVFGGFLALSAWRYFTVVAPAQEETTEEQSQSISSSTLDSSTGVDLDSELAENKGSLNSLDAYQSNLMTQLIASSWINMDKDIVLEFTTSSMTMTKNGGESVTYDFTLGDVVYAGTASADESEPDFVACVTLGNSPASLLQMRYSSITGAFALTITLTELGGEYFTPYVASDVKVVISDTGRELMGSSAATVEETIAAYCAAVFPTVTEVRWDNTLSADYGAGTYVFFFTMNDSASTTISVQLTKATGEVAVKKGMTTSFEEGYETPGVQSASAAAASQTASVEYAADVITIEASDATVVEDANGNRSVTIPGGLDVEVAEGDILVVNPNSSALDTVNIKVTSVSIVNGAAVVTGTQPSAEELFGDEAS